jgi:hypothetical protein
MHFTANQREDRYGNGKVMEDNTHTLTHEGIYKICLAALSGGVTKRWQAYHESCFGFVCTVFMRHGGYSREGRAGNGNGLAQGNSESAGGNRMDRRTGVMEMDGLLLDDLIRRTQDSWGLLPRDDTWRCFPISFSLFHADGHGQDSGIGTALRGGGQGGARRNKTGLFPLSLFFCSLHPHRLFCTIQIFLPCF